ncbi:hypothetical protein [Sphingobium sp. YG1]|uniref:hypothetical protein n=1 Tax=Sphingobium sp. YG1 TaxID=2082188 RepID=UPI000DBBADCB|nr:hypothetical protein [Sphingobium sp. YG1]BBC99120.1 hypothetical protein YGS_C1P0376 [Sphingobium sp. YG1]
MTKAKSAGPEYRVAKEGDATFDQMTEFVEAYRATMAERISATDPNDMSVAMVAAMIFAGTLAGSLISIGLFRDQDKRRLLKTMEHNFREGIGVGQRRAHRIAAEQFGEGQA